MTNKGGRPSNQAYWDSMIRKYDLSGQTQEEFCKAHDIKVATLKKRISGSRIKSGEATVRAVTDNGGELWFIISIPGTPQIRIGKTTAERVRDSLIGAVGEPSGDELSHWVGVRDGAIARIAEIKTRQYR